MKKLLRYMALPAVLTLITITANCQLIYNANAIGNRIYNPGLGKNNTPIILFDDINFPSASVGTNDSIVINKVTVAIGRAPGAPAVTVKFYATNVNHATADTFPVIPAKLIGTMDLPAGGPSNFFTVGDGITPLYTVAADTGFVSVGYQTLFIGLSFSDSTISNGWYLSSGPDLNYYTAFKYNSTLTPDSVYSFNLYGSYNLPATFDIQVYGTFKPSSTLPVTLRNFSAVKNDKQNLLTWTTETEVNSSKFIIERSSDGHTFTPIGEVKAAGKSSSTLNYSFTDNSPASGTNYYRLNSVDKDNKGAYSLIRSIRSAVNILFNLYPNPVINNINFVVNTDAPGKAIITVSDFNGRQVYNRAVDIIAGNNSLTIDMTKVAKGDYILKAQLNGENYTKTFTRK